MVPLIISAHHHSTCKYSNVNLGGDWNIRFDNVNRTNDSGELHVVSFGADFMGITTEGKGPHTHEISNFRAISK
jgi:hypothetical protein